MKVLRVVFRLGLLIGLGIEIQGLSAADQTTPPKEAQPPAPGLSKLTSDEARRTEELNKAIDVSLKADRWEEAISKAEELLALRTRVQGVQHFEVVNTAWKTKTLRRLAALPKHDRAAFLSADDLANQAESLLNQGEYGAAQPLFEKVLEIHRRLLGDDHPVTSTNYRNLAHNLKAQGKYAAAQPLFENALEIDRRLLSDDHPNTALSYSSLAFDLMEQGKYKAAQPLFEKALQIDRRLLGDDHVTTSRIYNNLGMLLMHEGRYDAAQPLFEKVLAIRRRLLTDDHCYTATSYNNLAASLSSQGNYASAQRLYEKALEIRRRLLTDDHPDTAQSYGNLAANLAAQGKDSAAQPLLEKALEIHRRMLTDDNPQTASSYMNLAANLGNQGKHALAQPLYEKALAICRRLLSDDHPDSADTFDRLAMNLYAQGNYAAAEPLLEKALAIRRKLLSDDHPATALSYSHLAANLSSQGKHAAAQPLAEKALEIHHRMSPGDNPHTATSYNDLAAMLNAQGKYAAAQPLFEKALAINRRRLTEQHPDTANSYNSLGVNLGDQGNYAAAQLFLEKGLALRRQLLTEDHPQTALSYNNLAVNLRNQGKYAMAQPLLERALALRRQLLTDDHPDTALSYNDLAANFRDLGKYAEARDQWIRAVRSFEAARVLAAFTGLDRATAAPKVDALVSLAAVEARLGQPALAWARLEEDLGRGLLDELAARRDRRLMAQERAELERRVTELERLDRLFEAPMEQLEQLERRQRLEDLRAQRDRAQIALGELRSQIAGKYGALAGRVATLSEIQSVLPGDSALVAWVDREPRGPNAADPGGEHWGTVVRARGNPVWIRLPGTGKEKQWTEADTQLAGLVRDALRLCSCPSTTYAQPLIQRLRAQRLVPLTTALGATPAGLPAARRLIVLPSTAMAGVPVEALLEYCDPWIISYAPSATVLTYLRHQPRAAARGGLLALGDPVFAELDRGKLGVVLDPRPTAVAIQDQRRLNLILAAARPGSEHFARLPGTRSEVESLAHLFEAAHRPTRVLIGAEASEPALDRMAVSGELGRFAYIHLATHGVIDQVFPQQSAVILTQTGLPDPLEQAVKNQPVYDGRLAMREIQRTWELKAELVTLSACETAGGHYAGGEGFVGFTQALLMSGARSVCLSLWKVDDAATSLLMQRFYQNLLGSRSGMAKPLPKAEALAEAKAWLRELPLKQVTSLTRGEPSKSLKGQPQPAVTRFDHPYYWAGFVLIGDPD